MRLGCVFKETMQSYLGYRTHKNVVYNSIKRISFCHFSEYISLLARIFQILRHDNFPMMMMMMMMMIIIIIIINIIVFFHSWLVTTCVFVLFFTGALPLGPTTGMYLVVQNVYVKFEY